MENFRHNFILGINSWKMGDNDGGRIKISCGDEIRKGMKRENNSSEAENICDHSKKINKNKKRERQQRALSLILAVCKHLEKRPCERMEKRHLSASQKDTPHQNLPRWHLGLKHPASEP